MARGAGNESYCYDCGYHRDQHLTKNEIDKMEANRRMASRVDPKFLQQTAPIAPEVATFSSGAVRSEKAPPWFMFPWDALRVVLERFNIGAIVKKYGIHNWKKAIGTGDLEFIRQLFDHLDTHLIAFIQNVGNWHVDSIGKHKDETPMDHLAAAGWAVLALITYTLYDRKNVQKAFSQWPASWTDTDQPLPTHGFELRENHWVPKDQPEPMNLSERRAEIDGAHGYRA